jgi:hypothetical protein
MIDNMSRGFSVGGSALFIGVSVFWGTDNFGLAFAAAAVGALLSHISCDLENLVKLGQASADK